MTRNLFRLALAASLALSVPAFAEAPAWRGVDAATGQLTAVEDLQQLALDFPDSSIVRLRLLNALADAGDTEGAGRQALELAKRGYVFQPDSERQISGWLDPDFQLWFHNFEEANRKQVEASSLLATVPPEARLVEGVARDPKTGDLYATTVVSRALFVKRGEAAWEQLPLEETGSLSGIAYDPKLKRFWIASGNFDQTPGEKVYSAVLGFDPVQGKIVGVLYANGMTTLGDVAVGDGSAVYVSDPVDGIIHYAVPGDQGLHALVGPGVFRSPQGMVAVPGKKLLIVSDYRYGLAAFDVEAGKAFRIASAKPALLDGIDGLVRYGKSLIAVQNGTSPKRILKLDMADDWLSIKKVTVLESNHSGWTEPVGGSVDGDRLLYVATGQWDRFGEGGALVDGAQSLPTEIRALPLGK